MLTPQFMISKVPYVDMDTSVTLSYIGNSFLHKGWSLEIELLAQVYGIEMREASDSKLLSLEHLRSFKYI